MEECREVQFFCDALQTLRLCCTDTGGNGSAPQDSSSSCTAKRSPNVRLIRRSSTGWLTALSLKMPPAVGG